MALMLDGFAVLRGMASNPGAFQAVISEAAKVARTLVVKQLKARDNGLDSLRAVRAALGDEFVLILEGMKDTEVKSLLLKFDKHYPDLKNRPASEHRSRLVALAEGAEPSTRPSRIPTKSAPRKRPAKKTELERLSSTAMAAVRKPRSTED